MTDYDVVVIGGTFLVAAGLRLRYINFMLQWW
jgi:hypothetical protein